MASTITVPDFCCGDTVEMLDPELRKTQKFWYVRSYVEASELVFLGSDPNGYGQMPSVHKTDVKLARRGNFFNFLFGFPLEFTDLLEETAFWDNAKQLKLITNPARLNYVWSLDQAIKALADGRVDGFQPFRGFTAPESQWDQFFVYKAATPDLGLRLRHRSLNRLQAVKRSLKAK